MPKNEADYTFEPPYHLIFTDEAGNVITTEKDAKGIPQIGDPWRYGETGKPMDSYQVLKVTGNPFDKLVYVRLRPLPSA